MNVKLNNASVSYETFDLIEYKLTKKEIDLVLSIAHSYHYVLEKELVDYADADGTKYEHDYAGKKAMEIGLEMGAISSLIRSLHDRKKRKDQDSISKWVAPYEEENK